MRVQSFDLATQEVKTILETPVFLAAGDWLTGFAATKDSGFISLVRSKDGTSSGNQTSRLVTLSDSPQSVDATGLQEGGAQSILRLSDGGLGVLLDKGGETAPRIERISPEDGRIIQADTTVENQQQKQRLKQNDDAPEKVEPGATIDNSKFRPNVRVRGLAQCPDNNFIGYKTDRSGITSLALIGEGKDVPLTFQGRAWNNGFLGLVCSPSGEIFGLGNLRYEGRLYLHLIDRNSGEVKRLKEFDVTQISLG
ncbi:MAG: hypothetical protein HC908_01045 [Calothrix sp. SM1_7_51]|nr:hypothetical protein [Calothrix sp. SM1_7_51]